MIALLQRVTSATVSVNGETIATIGRGLLVLVAVEADDAQAQADRLLERLLGYRMFADGNGKMNLSVRDIDGGLLLVPQFTLAADTRKGTRPDFSPAASPTDGRPLFDYLATLAASRHPVTACGRFGADMQVALVNDGPVTFWLRTAPRQSQ
jgi:D-tyrosyl-tRNA(Tyr) deacylase